MYEGANTSTVQFEENRIPIFFFDYMSVYNNGLARICEIHPVIGKDMVKILTGLDSTTCKTSPDLARTRLKTVTARGPFMPLLLQFKFVLTSTILLIVYLSESQISLSSA